MMIGSYGHSQDVDDPPPISWHLGYGVQLCTEDTCDVFDHRGYRGDAHRMFLIGIAPNVWAFIEFYDMGGQKPRGFVMSNNAKLPMQVLAAEARVVDEQKQDPERIYRSQYLDAEFVFEGRHFDVHAKNIRTIDMGKIISWPGLSRLRIKSR